MAGNVSRLGALAGKVFNTLRATEPLESQIALFNGDKMNKRQWKKRWKKQHATAFRVAKTLKKGESLGMKISEDWFVGRVIKDKT